MKSLLYKYAEDSTTSSDKIHEVFFNEFPTKVSDKEKYYSDLHAMFNQVFNELVQKFRDGNTDPLDKLFSSVFNNESFNKETALAFRRSMLMGDPSKPLHTAIWLGKLDFVKYLCKIGISVMTREEYSKWLSGVAEISNPTEYYNFSATKYLSAYQVKGFFAALLEFYKFSGKDLPDEYLRGLQNELGPTHVLSVAISDYLARRTFALQIEAEVEKLKLENRRFLQKGAQEVTGAEDLHIRSASSSSSSSISSAGVPALAGSDDSRASPLRTLSLDAGNLLKSSSSSNSSLDFHTSASSASSSAGVLSQSSSASGASSSTSLSSITQPESPAGVEGAAQAVSVDGRSRKTKRKAEEQITPDM